jgi:hypothetical protein
MLVARPCAAEWRRVDGPNFVVVGDASAATLRDVSLNESMRVYVTRRPGMDPNTRVAIAIEVLPK